MLGCNANFKVYIGWDILKQSTSNANLYSSIDEELMLGIQDIV